MGLGIDSRYGLIGIFGTMRTRAMRMVGRDTELTMLRQLLTAARNGAGGSTFIVGESGVGRSRLLAEAARQATASGMVLSRGRGSSIGPIVPFRSLTEALLSLTRAITASAAEELGPYRPILGRLIPGWGEAGANPEERSVVVLAEGVLRLTSLAGRATGAVMILDDLQYADAETLAVLEYLVDNLVDQPVALLAAVRGEDCPALEVARSAVQRGVASLRELDRFDENQLREFIGACLGCPTAEVPELVAEHLWHNSAGNPSLVEELLAGMVDTGSLVGGPDGWRVAGPVQTTIPASLARRLAQRFDHSEPRQRELLQAAAVLGQRFPLTVLQVMTGLDDRGLLRHLHDGLAGELVRVDEHSPDWYAFRQPLAAGALLGLCAPTVRASLAARAADAVQEVHPDLSDDWCQLAATLRLDAGDRVGAGRLFAEAGRRALANGAAESAVRLLEQARSLVVGDRTLHPQVLESLVHALAEAGQIDRSLSMMSALDSVGGVLDRHRRAVLHTRLAWAANLAARPVDGLAQIDAARRVLGPDATDAENASIDVIAAHLVIDMPGQEQLLRAEAMARRAAIVAARIPLPVVACQAWQLLGALVRERDLDEATACLERSRSFAIEHGLPLWEIHALVRLGNDDALREADLGRLHRAREVAVTAGAVTAGYQAEASTALHAALRGDYAEADEIVDRVLVATTRLHLIETARHLLQTRAIAAGHRGRRREMDQAIAELRRHQVGTARPEPKVYGLARTFCALLEENATRAREELAITLESDRDNSALAPLVGRHGLHLLLQALDGELDFAGYQAARAVAASDMRWNRQFALFAGAVLAGRAGRTEQAMASMTAGLRAAQAYPLGRHLGLRLVGEAALRDGWADSVEWLREAESFFHEAGVPAVASACRAQLRRAGVLISQRREGADEIPAVLRSAGVTVREYEVLQLMADRPGNREIADRLHLSPRTVEKYVAQLITKTGRSGRVGLSELAVSIVRS